MDEIDKKKEPIEFEPVFYYSREHRLQRASLKVQEFNASKNAKRPSIFGTLTGTRSNTMLLITILVMCVLISVLSRVVKDRSTYVLAGSTITASARQVQGEIYLDLTRSGGDYTGAVNIVVAGSSDTSNPVLHRVFFSLNEKETYHFRLPFKDSQVLILMQTETDEQLSMKINCK
jgi:hypothetical protein